MDATRILTELDAETDLELLLAKRLGDALRDLRLTLTDEAAERVIAWQLGRYGVVAAIGKMLAVPDPRRQIAAKNGRPELRALEPASLPRVPRPQPEEGA